jgi:hypothetical protein
MAGGGHATKGARPSLAAARAHRGKSGELGVHESVLQISVEHLPPDRPRRDTKGSPKDRKPASGHRSAMNHYYGRACLSVDE